MHVLVRTRNEDGLTFAAHAEVLARNSSVMFGKMGKPLAALFMKTLNGQLARGVKTYLFLTTRQGWNGSYVTEACQLRQVYAELEPDKRALVPTYYIAEAPKIRTWFEIVSMTRLTREEMNRIVVVSSGREIMSVIKSTAAVFRVSMRPAAIESPVRTSAGGKAQGGYSAERRK